MTLNERDRVLLRAKDVVLLTMILGLMGLLIGPMKKIVKFDNAVDKIEALEVKINEHDRNIAVISSQYAEINVQLKEINWYLRGQGNSGQH